MASTSLESLSLAGFRSFKTESEVTFPANGLVLITGPSGAGKSSLLLALAYALDYCPYPSTELQTWFDTDLQVKLALQTELGRVVVQRGTKPSLKVGTSKAITSAKGISEKLREVLGLSPGMVEALTYRQQQERGRFLAKSNAEKQEFLSTLLNLQVFEAALEKASASLGLANTDVAKAQEAVQLSAKQLTDLRAAQSPVQLVNEEEYEELIAELAQSKIPAAKESLNKSTANLRLAENSTNTELVAANIITDEERTLREHLEEIKAARPIPVTVLDGPLKEYERMLAAAKARLAQVQKEEQDRYKAFATNKLLIETEIRLNQGNKTELAKQRVRIEEKRRDLALMNSTTCPTCEQPWVAADSKRQALETEIATIDARIVELQQGIDAIPGLQKELAQMAFEPSPLPAKFEAAIQDLTTKAAAEKERIKTANDTALMEYKGRLNDIEKMYLDTVRQRETKAWAVQSKWNPIIAEARATAQKQVALLEQLQRDLAAAETGLTTARKFNDEMLQIQKSRTNQLEALKNAAGSAQERLSVAEAKANAESEFIRMVGREGFMGAIFDEILAEISDETNSLLGRIANTQSVVLTFESEVLTQKGTTKKEIRPVVTIGGAKATSLAAGCSGGMRTAIELAVDVAMRRVITRRTGSFPQWLCLDEAFEGLDFSSKEACMEILAAQASESLILVVDHNTVFQELFTKRIVVENHLGESRIV
jgi:DNA repair exonuclease SbcCD ATPase subunit